jgi:peptidoglycan/LPS O-acetylase OafA/YrhL
MRQDIQGLRAIAVLAVVIFHIVPFGLTGGYLGVDMFFVISGYVISLKIRNEIQHQRFSLLQFYHDRMKRLLPVLLLMLLVTTLLAMVILLPIELRQFSLNLIASIFFMSNFVLMTQDGYFDQSSENNPLLHLWSLAVEEHYYLFFPLFFVWLLRKPTNRQAGLLVMLTLGLFAAGVWWVGYDRDVAFYLSPLRFYQFLAGVISACYLPAWSAFVRIRAALAIGSFSILIACFWYYNKATPSPGWPSLVPTLATMILLHCAYSSAMLNLLLGHRLMTTVGNASYSIYLWHWPLIVYYKLAVTMQINLFRMLLLLTVSIVVGYFSWRFIEQPFRSRGPHAGAFWCKAPQIQGLICVVVMVMLAFAFYQQQGFPQRFSAEQVRMAAYLDYDSSDYRRQQCFLTNASVSFHEYQTKKCLTTSSEKPDILLIGDSHSAHLYSALQQSFPRVNVLQVSASGCKPLIPLTGRAHCVGLMEWLYGQQLNSDFSVDAIILAALWKKDDLRKMQHTIRQLSVHAPVIVIGPSIQYSQALPRLLSHYPPENIAEKFSDAKKIKALDLEYQTKIPAFGASYISLYQWLCPKDQCQTLTSEQIPVQWDTSHFTKAGAQLVVKPAFSPLVERLAPRSLQPMHNEVVH